MALPNRSNQKQNTTAHNALLTTILYADLFDFPLTKDEIWRFLIAKEKVSQKTFAAILRDDIPVSIRQKNGYFCLEGKEATIQKRINNLQEVESKKVLARFVAEKLRSIPTVQFIGISGGLSVKNVTSEDDIDLFFIVEKNTVFLTRFWILVLLERMHLRRVRQAKETKNKICVNLLIDETVLVWRSNMRNLYTAREIAQIVPLFERKGTYKKFLQKNQWISQYLPNFFSTSVEEEYVSAGKKQLVTLLIELLAKWKCEVIFRILQMTYMRPHITIEDVTKHQLALHPIDYKSKTLNRLRLKMRDLGLLTIF